MLVEYDASLPEWLELEEVAVALSHIAVQLHQAERVVALLGAGVSTAAGIQDFRSTGAGLYRASSSSSRLGPSSSSPPLSPQKARAMFCSNVYSTSASRAEHWQFVTGLKRTVDAIASDKEELGGHVTVTHALLRRLKKMGKFARVYTQNVDGLEQVEGLRNVKLPGVTSQSKFKGKGKAVDQELGDEEWEGDVVQLHGSTSSVRCSACSWVGKWLSKHTRAFAKGETLDCPACAETTADRARRGKRSTPIRSYVRPAILLYDEPSPAAETIGAIAQADLSSSPDMLLVFGTSLKIPGFKALVRQFSEVVHGQRGIAVLVNREAVAAEWDEVFDYHVLANCDDFVERLQRDSRLSGLGRLESKTDLRAKRQRRSPPPTLSPADETTLSPPTTATSATPPAATLHRSQLSFRPFPLLNPSHPHHTSSSSPAPCEDFFAPSSSSPAQTERETDASSLPPSSSPSLSWITLGGCEGWEGECVEDSQPEGEILGGGACERGAG